MGKDLFVLEVNLDEVVEVWVEWLDIICGKDDEFAIRGFEE